MPNTIKPKVTKDLKCLVKMLEHISRRDDKDIRICYDYEDGFFLVREDRGSNRGILLDDDPSEVRGSLKEAILAAVESVDSDWVKIFKETHKNWTHHEMKIMELQDEIKHLKREIKDLQDRRLNNGPLPLGGTLD